MSCHGVFFWGSQDPCFEHSPTCKPFPPCLRPPNLLCLFSSACSALVIFPSAIFLPCSWVVSQSLPCSRLSLQDKRKESELLLYPGFQKFSLHLPDVKNKKIVVKRKQQDEEQYVGQPHLSIKVSAVQISVPNSSQEKSGEGNLPRGRSRAENFSQVSIPLCKSLERQKGSEQYISHVPQICITLLFSKASGKTRTKLSYVCHI